MTKIVFPAKDLARRKLQTSLTLLGLTTSAAVTVFLTVFGETLGFEVALATFGKLSIGFSCIVSRFASIDGFLNLLVGILVTSFLVSVMMHACKPKFEILFSDFVFL